MLWLNKFHDDHMALVRILPKFEGNLKDIEYGDAGANVIWELKEFAELIKNVVIPHFKEEEKVVYPKASAVDEAGHKFILSMYDEHNDLYDAFDGFFKSLEEGVGNEIKDGKKLAREISMSGNFTKYEVPKNLDKKIKTDSLDNRIDREKLLKNGYKIVQLLKEHIEKEETTVADLVKRTNESEKE